MEACTVFFSAPYSESLFLLGAAALYARPLRIYEALRLLGAEPGHPVRYDEDTARWESPDGERLHVSAEWRKDGQWVALVDVARWMADAHTGKALDSWPV